MTRGPSRRARRRRGRAGRRPRPASRSRSRCSSRCSCGSSGDATTGWLIIKPSSGCCAPSSARVGARTGVGHRRGIEHRVVRRGREERRVRPQVRDVREPRLAGRRAVVDEVEEPVGEEHGLAVLGVVLRAPPRALGRLVDEEPPVVGHVDAGGAHPVEPRAGVALGEVADRIEAGQHAFVGAEPRVVGRDGAGIDARVGVAEERGLVALLAGDAARRWCGGRRAACR